MIGGDFLDRIAQRVRRGTLNEHYRSVFDSPSGRIVLTDLARRGLVLEQMEGWDPDRMSYTAGRRDLALYILERLRARPQDLQQLAELEVFDD